MKKKGDIARYTAEEISAMLARGKAVRTGLPSKP
jgi:hypothetical protein